MLANNSNYKIEPNKCIIEDLEILAFESEEQQRLYTIWHEALVDKRRELEAETERERQIIRNEIARKNRQLIVTVPTEELKRLCNGAGSKNSNKSSSKTATSKNAAATQLPSTPEDATITVSAAEAAPSRGGSHHQQVQAKLSHQTSRSSQLTDQRQQQSNQSRVSLQTHNGLGGHHQQQSRTSLPSRPIQSNGLPDGLPNGLTILNSAYYNTQTAKHVMRYKLTKLYNKYRGRQLRRNFVIEKQRNSKIEAEISRSYLNPWLTYTALQALRLPETNVNTLNTTTNNNTKILTPMAQQPSASSTNKKAKTPSKRQQQQQQTKAQAQSLTPLQSTQNPPMHLVYIDPGNIITYSNRINPQQVAEYKQKSHLLPSSATSKKSSAASYDVYEIMEVLANTNKTNVTITRNANRPSHGGAATTSIYSHSVNANTPGIVSTQLHLQARSYRDSMRKFYTEEVQRMEQQREELETEPDHEELISRYLKI